MEPTIKPTFLMVSGACCSPNLARHDIFLEKTFQLAASELGLDIELRKISLSSMLHGGGDLTPKQREHILALFNAYGTKFTPALLFGDEVRFAGKTPSLEQLKEALQMIAEKQP